MDDLLQLKHLIQYDFACPDLLREAMTHRSYSAEKSLDYDNQRLEFLGDAVLEIILSEYLYRRYPDSPEGMLTKMRAALVQQEALAGMARQFQLDRFLRMGRGELESGGAQREAALCDVFEALTGAIYLDAGVARATELILPWFEQYFPDPEALVNNQNPKGALQELTQRRWNKAPEYQLIDVSGPDHDPHYRVAVCINGQTLGNGEAGKRKTAESLAARDAIEKLTQSSLQSEEPDHD